MALFPRRPSLLENQDLSRFATRNVQIPVTDPSVISLMKAVLYGEGFLGVVR